MDDSRLDRSVWVDGGRRHAAAARAWFADRVSQALDQTTDERLDRLMRSPARRAVLAGIFWQMPRYLDRGRAAGVNAAVLWRIGGRANGETDDFQLQIAEGRAVVQRGPSSGRPIVTMTIDGVDFLKLITGTLDPMQAYFAGQIELAGDIMFAAKLGGLFKMPLARPDPLA
jgi:hypothetical protein